ncbi:radical SAM protein [Candidatus Woesearchaeota archaeon]|nr:radical SAM protein [Candidatus Woesearchaeota archaeon]
MENAEQTVSRPLKISLVQVINPNVKGAMNKDLNGGFGTADDYGTTITSKILQRIKGKWVRLPVISFAFLQTILREKGHTVTYYEESLPEQPSDLILLYGSIVDYKYENEVGQKLKMKFPEATVGFFGPFVSVRPDLFGGCDFVLIGEPEPFFMHDFTSLDQLKGNVLVKSATTIEDLPTPSYDGFPLHRYGYSPANNKRPFLVLLASKGCPYSCRYYCVYGEYQGAKIRQRSPKKVVDDIVSLQQKHNIKGVQFRDPVFGLNRNFIPEFCDEIMKRHVKIQWGMETRLDLLNEENLKMMYAAGLRNLNVGIETNDPEVAKQNKRLLVQQQHQEHIIRFCDKLGIKVSAFYIIGYDGDTVETVRNTIKYAVRLNTPLARFAVSTPYPGTRFYDQMEASGRLLTKDYTHYTQFHPVYRHENLSPEQITALLSEAYRKYYFRLGFVWNTLRWKIRELTSA